MQDIEPAHPLVSRENISRRISFGMSHVKSLAAGIREHVHDVELRFCRVEPGFTGVSYPESLLFPPDALPLRLEIGEWILFSSLAHLSCDPGGATFGVSCHDANTFSCDLEHA
jgi:hypothetical protein